MAGRLRFSHVLIRVDDLHAAVAGYTALGFQCVWGGPAGRAHNALIYFADGPFLELFRPPAASGAAGLAMAAMLGRPTARRIRRWADAPEGLVEFALETDDTDLRAVRADLRAAGAPLARAFGTTRTRPDGVRLAWQIAAPPALDLPFVMSAYSPPDTQPPDVRRHENGARRLVGLELAHPEPVALRTRLAILLGEDPVAQGITIAKGRGYGLMALALEGLRADIPPETACGATFRVAREG
jgi:catechol 2,3-dioxygenase-like lactoylglutathione lyase family enzyme